MPSQGPLSPSTLADDSGTGSVAWTNPGNAASSNDTYATSFIETQTTHYLKCTNFGFSIPAGSVITGFLVECEVSGGGATDAAVRLVKAGTIGSTDRSSATVWTGTDAYLSHGGMTDLWGDTWTPADVNNSGFGAALAAFDAGPVTCQVDHVRITVYYTGGADALDWYRPVVAPPPPRVAPNALFRAGWFAFPTERTLDQDWPPFIFPGWFQRLQEPVRRPATANAGVFAQGNLHEAASDVLLPHWGRPLERPVRPPPRVQPGWFGAGYDPAGQSYGVPDWWAPIIQPLRWSSLESKRGLVREAWFGTPWDPTATNSGQAFAWHAPTQRPVWKVPPRQEGLFVRPLEPTQLDLGGFTQWFQAVRQPVRRPAAPTPGFFVLTMHPDSLGVIQLEAWLPPLAVPVRRPAKETVTALSPRHPGLSVQPLEPTQINVGEAVGWQTPLARPVARRTSLAYTRLFGTDAGALFQPPELGLWYVPLQTPTRPAPPRHPGFFVFQQPPGAWSTGVVVAGPFYVIETDFYQAGGGPGDLRTR